MSSNLRKPVRPGPPADFTGLVTAQELRHYIANCRCEYQTYEQIADEMYLTPSFVGMVLNGAREPSKAFLDAAGFERVTLYRLKRVARRRRA